MKKTSILFALLIAMSAGKSQFGGKVFKETIKKTAAPTPKPVIAQSNAVIANEIATTNMQSVAASVFTSATVLRPDGTKMSIRPKTTADGIIDGGARIENRKPGTKATATEGNEAVLCTVEYGHLNVKSMDQDILNDNIISNIKIGGAFSLQDLQRQGRYNIINTGINPIRLQIDGGVQDNQIVVANPDAASLSQALNTLKLRTATVKPTVNGYFEYNEVFSNQELELKLGLNFSGIGFKVNDKFNFNQSSTTRKLFLDFKERTFSVQAFADNNGYFNAPPTNGTGDVVYVDKINFGRRVMVFFETNEENMELTNKLNVNVNSGATTVDVNLDVATKEKLAKTEFKAISYGTTKSLNVVVTGIDELKKALNNYFNEINNVGLTPEQWGKPISYSLKYINGDIAVASAYVENLPKRTCQANPTRPVSIGLNLMRIETRGDADLFGHVHVKYFYANGNEITNTTTPGNPQIWSVSEAAHYGSNQIKVFATQIPSSTALGVRLTMQDILDGAYCRIYTNLNDYDTGLDGENDYLALRETNGPAYRQVQLSNLLTICNPANGKTGGCVYKLEAAESSGSCTFHFEWGIN
jgi:hypothetical protein